jgi:hypothetical protein
MFAVFAESFRGDEFYGKGDTPQLAWENMLGSHSIDEEDTDIDTVQFYRAVEVNRETKITWTVSDTDDE